MKGAERAKEKLREYAENSRAVRLERAEARALLDHLDALEAEHAEWRQRAIERLDQLSEHVGRVWLSRDEAEAMRDKLLKAGYVGMAALLDERMKP